MTPNLDLTSHKVLVFDVYGTLIDWESGIYNSLKSLFPKDTPREEVLEKYAAVELDLQMKDPSLAYSKILDLAWMRLSGQADMSPGRGKTAAVTEGGEEIGASSPAGAQQDSDMASSTPPASDAERFGASVPTWQPFEDTVQALHRLKEHFALVVLSNVDNRSFDGTHELLKSQTREARKSKYPTETPASPFSLILTAQQFNAYKPDPRALDTALQQVSSAPRSLLPHPNPPWAVEAREVLVVANSLQHDIEPANLHNLNSVWISRHEKNIIGAKADVKERGLWTWRFETLGDLADAVDQEVQGTRDAI
ncbi:haloacid dehalogenase [Suillus clintonianus]|uniref:haloacid dehalogenase n=1 Tax=Suillus clintonianus TaxID=1904413 RepID=UPI001B8807A0|nr:haloacid dehalogenase [Suillus clintonianus]KAG2142484.1 haloacid dehalogenase [Suillus clintonianus]